MKQFKKIGILLALPGILGFLLFYIVPFIVSLYYSLSNNTFQANFVGLENYISVLNNQYYILALKNTILFSLIAVPISMVISFIIAMLLLKTINIKYSRFLKASFILPVFIPSVALITFWEAFFGNNSRLFNLIYKLLSETYFDNINVLINLVPIYLFFIWKNIGLFIIIYIAGILKIPKEYTEAAQIDGASPLKCYTHITFPLLTPVIFSVLIMSIVQSFKIFKEVYLLHGAYPSDELYFVQHYANNKFLKLHYGELSAGTIIFIVIICFILISILSCWKLTVKKYEE